MGGVLCVLVCATKLRHVFQGTPMRVCQRCAFLLEVRREECVGVSNDTLRACVCIGLLLASHLVVCIDICGPCGPTSPSFLVTYIFRRPTFMWLAAHFSFHHTHLAFPCGDLLTDFVSVALHGSSVAIINACAEHSFLVCSGVIFHTSTPGHGLLMWCGVLHCIPSWGLRVCSRIPAQACGTELFDVYFNVV